ncbi:hypothetical protein XPA_010760 [Xanthoria parietina]
MLAPTKIPPYHSHSPATSGSQDLCPPLQTLHTPPPTAVIHQLQPGSRDRARPRQRRALASPRTHPGSVNTEPGGCLRGRVNMEAATARSAADARCAFSSFFQEDGASRWWDRSAGEHVGGGGCEGEGGGFRCIDSQRGSGGGACRRRRRKVSEGGDGGVVLVGDGWMGFRIHPHGKAEENLEVGWKADTTVSSYPYQ